MLEEKIMLSVTKFKHPECQDNGSSFFYVFDCIYTNLDEDTRKRFSRTIKHEELTGQDAFERIKNLYLEELTKISLSDTIEFNTKGLDYSQNYELRRLLEKSRIPPKQDEED